MVKSDSHLVKGTTTLLVLTALSERPMHGYELVRNLEQRAQGLLSFKQGTVYPLLYSLEDRGLLRSAWKTGDTGRERKVYSVTRKGKQVLAERVADWERLVRGMRIALEGA